jgi:propionate CoA-transferase
LKRDVIAQAEFPLSIAPELRRMDAALFHPAPINLNLRPAREPLQ